MANSLRHKVRHNGRKLILILAGTLVGFLVLRAVIYQFEHRHDLVKQSEALAVTPVTVTLPTPAKNERTIELPANLAAWYEAPIYGQVTGYVRMWYVDIGSPVKEGQVLAEVSTPELDAQYAQAKAQYSVVEARYRLAEITAKRWAALKNTKAVSQQEVDVQAANAQAQQAELEAALHEVERYEALENFKKIVAPFDGIVTARNINVGDFVNSGGGSSGTGRGRSQALFSVADVHKIRAYVSVPQDYSSNLASQVEATFTSAQYPGKEFEGHFLATAQEFDPATRTSKTEFILDNPDKQLWPNAYMTAHIKVPRTAPVFLLPTGSLIFRGNGMQVAVVEGNHAKLRSVEVGVDFGLQTEILAGLTGKEKVIVNPSVDILDDDQVEEVTTTRGYNFIPSDTRKEKKTEHTLKPTQTEVPTDSEHPKS